MTEYAYSEQGPPSCRHAVSTSLHMIVSDRGDVDRNMRRQGMGDIACLYLLVDTAGRRVYVGETENARERIAQHCKGGGPARRGGDAPRLDGFDKVAIVWDGRPIQTTRFSDGAIRKELEARLIRAFAGHGNLSPVNASSSGSRANLVQADTIASLAGEMLFVLHKFGYLGEPPGGGEPESAELSDEEAAGVLGALGLKAVSRKGPWIECEDGSTVYAVTGSRKDYGWQITVRDDLLRRLEGGEANLRVMLQRTRACVLPSSFLGPLVSRNKAGYTVDLYIDDRRRMMKCGRQNDIDVGAYMAGGAGTGGGGAAG